MSHAPDGPAGEQPENVDPRESRGSRDRSLDDVFEVLAAERRRYALYVLCRRSGKVAVPELADAVASSAGANPARVTAELYHVHLPKLAEEGVVEYDREDGIVRYEDDCERFGRYLAAAADDEDEPLRRRPDDPTLSEF